VTINTASNKTIALGNGSQTQFAFGFVGVSAAYIEVIYTDASGNETVLTQGNGTTQYQISLNSPPQGGVWGIGGTVTYDPSGTPIATGTSLTIFRTLPLTQAISLQNQISLSQLGDGAETGLDTVEMQLQQVSELFQRALVAPITDPSAPLPLPTAQLRANQILGFDGSGNPIAAQPSSALVSSVMAAVVSAATLAIARTALGLGNIAVENIGSGLQDDGAGNLRANATIVEVSTNQTITSANHLNRFIATGTLTFTLPAAHTLWDGFGFWIEAFTGSQTIAPQSGDTIKGNASGASIIIPAGCAAFITTDAAGSGVWYVEGMQATSMPVTGGSFTNLIATNDAVTPNTKWDVSATELVLTNSTGGAVRLVNIAWVIDATTNGLNGLDTGSLAANTWYYHYAIANENGSVGGLLSLSSTAPALPSGYTFVKRLGSIRTDGSAHFKAMNQRGAQHQLTNAAGYPIIASGVQLLAAFSTAAGAPPTAYSVRGILAFIGSSGAAASVYAGTGGTIPVAQTQNNITSATISTSTTFDVIPDTPGFLYYAANGSGPLADLYIAGYFDSI
jgi:hypothetical protein